MTPNPSVQKERAMQVASFDKGFNGQLGMKQVSILVRLDGWLGKCFDPVRRWTVKSGINAK